LEVILTAPATGPYALWSRVKKCPSEIEICTCGVEKTSSSFTWRRVKRTFFKLNAGPAWLLGLFQQNRPKAAVRESTGEQELELVAPGGEVLVRIHPRLILRN
jgi:hypothetical protein